MGTVVRVGTPNRGGENVTFVRPYVLPLDLKAIITVSVVFSGDPVIVTSPFVGISKASSASLLFYQRYNQSYFV